MTISSVLSTLPPLFGVGISNLGKGTPAVQPIRPIERRPDHLSQAEEQEGAPESEVGSRFDTRDTVELSDAAIGKELTPEEQKQVEQLKQRDAEVRRHEAAHQAAAGPHAQGGPSFDYQVGPDGRRYAVGGEVQIDTSPIEGDPEATIAKMEQIRAAALAPAEPSGQDQRVAAEASAKIREARAEQARQKQEENDEVEGEDEPGASSPRTADGPRGGERSASAKENGHAEDRDEPEATQVQPERGLRGVERSGSANGDDDDPSLADADRTSVERDFPFPRAKLDPRFRLDRSFTAAFIDTFA